MAEYTLKAHPDTPVDGLTVSCTASLPEPGRLHLVYAARGGGGRIVMPPPAPAVRTFKLWEMTCFEVFLAAADGTYVEYNFSPTGAWACFRFDSHRSGMRDALDLDDPRVVPAEEQADLLRLEAFVELAPKDVFVKMAISGVIRLNDGSKSYWALNHPPGDEDFHHADCFAATFPPR